MRPLLLCALLLGAGTASVEAQPFSHELLDGVLRAHVDSTGMVDYAGLKSHRASLDAYIDSLARTSPGNHPERFPSQPHELAYWINAYNAFVLQGVVDAYPVESVKDIGILSGFFNRRKVKAGGRDLTLNDIENEIIRPTYREPRVHFALNCGAVSCPKLAPRAYAGQHLEAHLEQALASFALDPKYARLTPDGRLHLSKILDWYGQDFLDWFPPNRPDRPAEPTIAAYLLPYLPAEAAAYLRQHPDAHVVYDEYDWALNRQATPR